MPAVATDRISAIQMQFIKRVVYALPYPGDATIPTSESNAPSRRATPSCALPSGALPLIVVPIKLLLTTLPLELPKMRTPSRPLAEIVLISVNGPVVEISPPTVFFDEFSMVMPSRLLGPPSSLSHQYR